MQTSKLIILIIVTFCLMLLPYGNSLAEIPRQITKLISQSQLNNKSTAKQSSSNVSTVDKQHSNTSANNLINEKSNYLLQHAYNPINWQPWGAKAFEQAKKENKPIFLSVGYATCHWCHVMRKESFENSAIADYLNKHFVSIKVDREQRPDIDEIYLTALKIFSGQGGWPISAFITPKTKPFLLSSYLSAEELMQQLKQVNQRWQSEQANIEQMANELHGYVNEALEHDVLAVKIRFSLVSEVVTKTLKYQDKQWGGIEQTPKFPMIPLLTLLINQATSSSATPFQESELDNFVQRNLNAMLQGGIYDQLAGGFHRYTSDRAWRKPHYEKMLYDQAQFISLYSQAWLVYQNPEYKRIALETAKFLLTNMQDSNSCFYSAIDADSADGSSDFYHWQSLEVVDLLNKSELELFNNIYGIAALDNKKNTGPLYLKENLAKLSKDWQVDYFPLNKTVSELRKKLLFAQSKRSAPKVDKIQILQWNAMTISALAKLGYIIGEAKYIQLGEKCAQSIWSKLANNKDRFARTTSQNSAQLPALLADNSQLLIAALTLYDVSHKQVWLTRAKQLYKVILADYWDHDSEAFFNTVNNNEAALLRTKYVDDTIMPAGNSSALSAMIMLQKRASTPQLKQQIKLLMKHFANTLNQRPHAMAAMLAAVQEYEAPQAKYINYAGQGNIRLTSKTTNSEGEFDIIIEIKDGWHINSNQPLDKQLIATSLSLVDATSDNKNIAVNIQYPKGKLQSLSFSNDNLSLYSKHAIIRVKFNNRPAHPSDIVKIQLQACNNKLCLLPEKLLLKLAVN